MQSVADEGDLPRMVSREEAMVFATASGMKYIEGAPNLHTHTRTRTRNNKRCEL